MWKQLEEKITGSWQNISCSSQKPVYRGGGGEGAIIKPSPPKPSLWSGQQGHVGSGGYAAELFSGCFQAPLHRQKEKKPSNKCRKTDPPPSSCHGNNHVARSTNANGCRALPATATVAPSFSPEKLSWPPGSTAPWKGKTVPSVPASGRSPEGGEDKGAAKRRSMDEVHWLRRRICAELKQTLAFNFTSKFCKIM